MHTYLLSVRLPPTANAARSRSPLDGTRQLRLTRLVEPHSLQEAVHARDSARTRTGTQLSRELLQEGEERLAILAALRRRRLRRLHRPRLPPSNDDLVAAGTVVKEICLNADGKTGCFEILGDSQHDSCFTVPRPIGNNVAARGFVFSSSDHLTVTTTEAAPTAAANITIETDKG
ncbi:hypothetical protein EXIGLDRAFT_31949 [Exidia glandulosa HHB12029]|uniref:Uncharacterized protein n=1 Tax=Exidia glandulosa HHB12029 TaxID=1314781 RepID=A0A165IUQ5_EXIGL|nr:hypothetical protein EXIGLDRAFT_31949 [Exidia glandulosa HHB12029]